MAYCVNSTAKITSSEAKKCDFLVLDFFAKSFMDFNDILVSFKYIRWRWILVQI